MHERRLGNNERKFYSTVELRDWVSESYDMTGSGSTKGGQRAEDAT